ncbi:MAG: GNAT family N-acetyltransferase [Hyphomicrobiaceae bacterium]
MRQPSIEVRAGLPSDCAEIAEMVQELARDTTEGVVPRATAEGLAASAFGAGAHISLFVAEDEAGLIGYCLTTPLYSTWRGARGIRVVDLYLRARARRLRLGERLLAAATAAGWREGARFVRLEVERTNVEAERFYRRLGFHLKENEHSYSLDRDPMQVLAGANDGSHATRENSRPRRETYAPIASRRMTRTCSRRRARCSMAAPMRARWARR